MTEKSHDPEVIQAELEAGFTRFQWAAGRVLCPEGRGCLTDGASHTVFIPRMDGTVPMHRGRAGEPCPGAYQKPTVPPLQLRLTTLANDLWEFVSTWSDVGGVSVDDLLTILERHNVPCPDDLEEDK